MSRTFFYARVSTQEQTTDNQVHEVIAAGFAIEPKRIVTESISGSVQAAKRPGFSKLLDRLESGDILIVTKLDRLGRNAMDVRATVDRLASEGVRVHCLQLGGADLTSAAGRMTMGVITAVAEFERDLLIERTNAGLNRAKAQGKQLGRPPAFTPEERAAITAQHAAGTSICALAREHGKARAVIQRAVRLTPKNPIR
jgi:putative DNA-invertase from lambdoid prophage Rac